MTQNKHTTKFSDNKLFWMTVLSLLLSVTTAIFGVTYVLQKTQLDRLVGESDIKFKIEMTRLQACYENDIKPCNQETLNEFNAKHP